MTERLHSPSSPSSQRLRSMLPFPALNDSSCRLLHHTTSSQCLLSSRHGSIHSDSNSATSSVRVSPLPPSPPPKDSFVSFLPRRRVVTQAHSSHGVFGQKTNPSVDRVPRSRTISSLPISTMASRGVDDRLNKSQPRTSSVTIASSRLPSPSFTTRRYTHSRLMSLSAVCANDNFASQRSVDAEETLPLSNSDSVHHRVTTFKENIPPISGKITHLVSPPYCEPPHNTPCDVSDTRCGNDPDLSTARRTINSLSTIRLAGEDQQIGVRPNAYHGGCGAFHDTRSLHVESMRRWISQPVLYQPSAEKKTMTDQPHGSVKFERSVHTPAAANSPSSRKVSTTGKSRRIRSFRSLLSRGDSSPAEQIPDTSSHTLSPSCAGGLDRGHITNAEPISYWCGRFSALNDRYRTEDMHACLQGLPTTYESMDASSVHVSRMRRALEHLHSLCTTQQALNSFAIFQSYIAALKRCDVLRERFAPPKLSQGQLEASPGPDQDAKRQAARLGVRISDARKTTFMNRILGKGRRSLF